MREAQRARARWRRLPRQAKARREKRHEENERRKQEQARVRQAKAQQNAERKAKIAEAHRKLVAKKLAQAEREAKVEIDASDEEPEAVDLVALKAAPLIAVHDKHVALRRQQQQASRRRPVHCTLPARSVASAQCCVASHESGQPTSAA